MKVHEPDVAAGSEFGDWTESGGASAGPSRRREETEELFLSPSGGSESAPDSPLSPVVVADGPARPVPSSRPIIRLPKSRTSVRSPTPELIRPASVAASPVDTHSELATVLLRLGEAVWGDARAAATEATRAFGSNYPNAQDYVAEREAVAGAIEGGQRKAWGLRGRLMELAAYVREGGAVPAWWTEYSGGAGGSSV